MSIGERRILVVEDEVVLAMMVQEQLEDRGAIVVGPAHSVQQALELLDVAQVDAAVLDVSLRGMASERVSEALRARRVPYVVTTGFSQPDFANESGAAVMRKPYRFQELHAALEVVLAGADQGNPGGAVGR